MPKEYIDDLYMGHDDDAVAAGSQCRVKVGWSKESGDIQIATVALEGMELRSEHPESNGWFVNLDRNSINRLIRVLRKARDDAYGKDA